jgi:hypothetical protein
MGQRPSRLTCFRVTETASLGERGGETGREYVRRPACAGVRGGKLDAEDSRRFQPPNLGEAVRDGSGKCVHIPPPLLTKDLQTRAFCLQAGLGATCRFYTPSLK